MTFKILYQKLVHLDLRPSNMLFGRMQSPVFGRWNWALVSKTELFVIVVVSSLDVASDTVRDADVSKCNQCTDICNWLLLPLNANAQEVDGYPDITAMCCCYYSLAVGFQFE